MELRKKLHEVDEELGREDVEALKFLCKSHIGARKLNRMESGKELFKALEDEDLMQDDAFIVAELLYIIKHYSLLRKLGVNKETMHEQLPVKGVISRYRKFLFELSEEITKQDLKAAKFLLQPVLPKCKLQDDMSMLGLLIEMEKQELLGEDQIEMLEKVCTTILPELGKRISKYKTELMVPKQETKPFENVMSSQGPEPLEPWAFIKHQSGAKPFTERYISRNQESNNSGQRFETLSTKFVQISVTGDDKNHASAYDNRKGSIDVINNSSRTSSVTIEQENSMDFPTYRMNHKHRGYCLIISNYDFSSLLPARRGTDTDTTALENVFTWLGFEVKIHRDKSAAEIRDIMKEFQGKDHKNNDCFACCILSHGESGTILGTDGCCIPIREITSHFTAQKCQVLAGKPKLFFIQACQGKKYQNPVFLESDAKNPNSIQETRVVNPQESIPEEADFLLGMATVDGFLSFRHIREGTWYIQSLCKNLCVYVPRGEDLLAILTKVNEDVSKQTAMRESWKQMPQPAFTLRKRLIFPVPTNALPQL
ncbi:caspase-8 isoform X2 [Latimeria chalumnae]|uniref:Caspase-8 n=2 Tax=Latimeria chalumnae TaxID=7897 RepID=H2ZXE8_LATCH|nr:PREDICTED: caspase-8-like [Latimeria chalumnae]XP_005995452.1 PREDICTED: caspase-8-like [Latimeria chalumnae]XP_014343567.1 PREDICTED: caspase-8-like [Latimeria chalumnae]XP_014343568.1 PREDICTED: caspase-8-like [Latimeria chalumnae]|eukprot:XP_005995451.1 PREDICTED: caspase-8-like [Latimeria chalumnae]